LRSGVSNCGLRSFRYRTPNDMSRREVARSPASPARKYVPDDHHGQQDQKDARKGSAT
jgi:hypothetical protein